MAATSSHSNTIDTLEGHDVLDRVLFVGHIPLDTKEQELIEMFDICLGKNSRTQLHIENHKAILQMESTKLRKNRNLPSKDCFRLLTIELQLLFYKVSFVQYPHDKENECYKGFAIVMLNRLKDVETCLSEESRHWFYLTGKPSQGGFNKFGKCYVRIRYARVEKCLRKEDATQLVFSPSKGADTISLREFKSQVENVIASMNVKPTKVEAEINGKSKLVRVHTVDGETASVVKMFCHGFKENGVTMAVRNALKPKVAKKEEPATPVKKEAETPKVNYSAEVVTENYARFGIPYLEAIKSDKPSSNTAASAPSKKVDNMLKAGAKPVSKPRNSQHKQTKVAGSA